MARRPTGPTTAAPAVESGLPVETVDVGEIVASGVVAKLVVVITGLGVADGVTGCGKTEAELPGRGIGALPPLLPGDVFAHICCVTGRTLSVDFCQYRPVITRALRR